MIESIKTLIVIVLFTSQLTSQNILEFNVSINKHVSGTLLKSEKEINSKIVILIGGSGPVDRDGNQSFMKTDMLKKLAFSLSKKGLATFRYDKRIVNQIIAGNIDKNMMFDDFVDDAVSVVNYFKSKYKTIVIAGHSQGSLVGLLCLDPNVSGFISISGVGSPIDKIIESQISKTAPLLLEDTKKTLEIMRNGNITEDFPIALSSIFNIDIQPFMINWMQYNPSDIIANVSIPCLIINGDKDLQVEVEEAKILNNSAKNSELLIVKNMNHVLVDIKGDELSNAKSYNNPNLEIVPSVCEKIIDFINKL